MMKKVKDCMVANAGNIFTGCWCAVSGLIMYTIGVRNGMEAKEKELEFVINTIEEIRKNKL